MKIGVDMSKKDDAYGICVWEQMSNGWHRIDAVRENGKWLWYLDGVLVEV